MPYKNIVFVKLYLDLFDDERFLFKLNERQQLLYIKMMYLAGLTKNKIPKSYEYINSKIQINTSKQQLNDDLEHIQSLFKKFTHDDEFLFFENFEELHNYRISSTRSELESSRKGKNKYGEYVYLTINEYELLTQRFGKDECDKWIKRLDDGIALKGYKYKSHYRAILKWADMDRKKQRKEEAISRYQNLEEF